MRFKVIGNHALDGTEPGGYVVIDDEDRARRLRRAGHIEPAPTPAKKATKKATKKAAKSKGAH